jgi:hypothetical protein
MSSTPTPNSLPTLGELVKKSKRLREQAHRLNAEMKELERMIALAAQGTGPEGRNTKDKKPKPSK